MKQVADLLGVSIYTVSSAINGRGAISPETRQRVLDKVAELGYVPKANGRWLVTGRSGLVALDDRREGLFGDPFAMQLLRGVQFALQEAGISLLLNVATGGAAETEQLRRWTQSRTVDGVLFVRSRAFDVEMIRQMAEARTPCVIIGTWTEDWPYTASIGVSHEGVRQAARLLVAQGHRRIGFISWAEPHMQSAFSEELARQGARLQRKYAIHLPATLADPKDGATALRSLMQREPRPTAVLCGTVEYAMGALREARSLGLRVPQDLSIIGHYDQSVCEVTDPPLTTVRLDGFTLGKEGAEMLLQLMQNPQPTQRRYEVATTLVVRESVAPAPVSSGARQTGAPAPDEHTGSPPHRRRLPSARE